MNNKNELSQRIDYNMILATELIISLDFTEIPMHNTNYLETDKITIFSNNKRQINRIDSIDDKVSSNIQNTTLIKVQIKKQISNTNMDILIKYMKDYNSQCDYLEDRLEIILIRDNDDKVNIIKDKVSNRLILQNT